MCFWANSQDGPRASLKCRFKRSWLFTPATP